MFPTAVANGKQSAQFLVIKSNNSKLQWRLIVNTVSENTTETRVAESELKYLTPTATFQNFRLLNMKGMKSGL